MPISQLPNFAQRTDCTQNVPMNVTSHLSANILLCNIGKPRYRQNSTGYQIFRIGYYYIFDYLDKPIPCIVFSISWFPDIPQKATCTQNVTMDVIFDLRYGPAFNDVNLLRNPWKYAKILFMCFFLDTLNIIPYIILYIIYHIIYHIPYHIPYTI